MTSPQVSPSAPPTNNKFYLFGYPIAHSFAPAFHNQCFEELGSQNRYELYSTSLVTQDVLDLLRSEECGGAAVTMPLKAAILPFLDQVSPESQATGACNTIVKVSSDMGMRLVGQNTDILGVLNALLRTLRTQHPDFSIPPKASYPASLKAAAMIIGGGATTRSAAYALNYLGLSPIYIINREESEVRAVEVAMPQITFVHLKTLEDVERELGGESKRGIIMAVGAIPAIPPVTEEEKMVYAVAEAVFSLRYRPVQSKTTIPPLPTKPIFLEMPYKPLNTPLLQLAHSKGWDTINGIQAMIQQGLAQQRMWFTSTPTIAIGISAGVLDSRVEWGARKLCENMTMDEGVVDEEVDRALE